MAAEEQYIVSARKYRPQTFDTVVGQEHITTTLKNAIRTGHLAHAYLFCGPRGVGKTTCARILARTLNCEHPTEDMEACGVCSVCKAFENNSSLNIFELDAASNNSVEDIRRLIEQVRYAPQHGKYKVYIIDEVHMLSTAAFNAFLKTLEEPPSYAIFILATTEKHRILPTILSRCQIFDFKRIKPKAIVNHLEGIAQKEGYETEEPALYVIAQESEGCMRDALSIMDRLVSFASGKLTYEQVIQHLNILDATTYFRLSEMLWVKDIGGVLLLLDDLLQRGFEGDLVINGFSEHFRNLLLCKDAKMAKLLEIPDVHKKRYYEHAQLLADGYIISALSILNQAELGYKNALNKRLHVELCLIKLCYLMDMVLPGEAISVQGQSGGVKKNLIQNSPATPAISPIEVKPKQPLSDETTSKELPSEPKEDKGEHKPVLELPSNEISEQEDPLNQNRGEGQPQQISAKPFFKIPTAGPKLSNNLLQVLQEKNKPKEDIKVIVPTQELVLQVFNQLKEGLRATNLLLSEQMELMTIKLVSPEEIQLLCSSEINLSYGKDLAKPLRIEVRKKTHQASLRVMPVYHPETVAKEPQDRVKSRQEIFEEFLKKNPALRKLKRDLNLGIDY